jgi:hypothetical protein
VFDHLRQQSRHESEPEEEDRGPLLRQTEEPARAAAPRGSGNFLGLTPAQRFVLALMLFLNVTVLGCAALIVFDRIMLPF